MASSSVAGPPAAARRRSSSSSSSGAAMTTTHSPRTSSRAAIASASSPESPRTHSSCSLVSSRTSATRLAGNTSAALASVAATRRGDSYTTSAPGMHESSSRRATCADFFLGKKPSKKKCSLASPLATRAHVTAEGPGTTSTLSPASSAASTSFWPGSLTPGMPASETNATRSPASRRSSTAGTRDAITFSSQRSSRLRSPKADSSLPVTRVSSHSTTSARPSTSITRGDASCRLPMGVPTTESRPAIRRSSRARSSRAPRARPSW